MKQAIVLGKKTDDSRTIILAYNLPDVRLREKTRKAYRNSIRFKFGSKIKMFTYHPKVYDFYITRYKSDNLTYVEMRGEDGYHAYKTYGNVFKYIANNNWKIVWT